MYSSMRISSVQSWG